MNDVTLQKTTTFYPQPYLNITSTQASDVRSLMAKAHENTSVMCFYMEQCKRSGNFVMLHQGSSLPYLQGNDGQPVLLYKFAEIMEECVDFDYIKAELPTLSYAQIAGAIEFFRKLAQFNVRDVDIDKIEEQFIEASPEFQELVKAALTDQEMSSVFSAP